MDNNHYFNPVTDDDSYNYGRRIIMHPLYHPKYSRWLDLKVFYVRMSNCDVNESTPEHLTLNHIPLTQDAVLEVNGRRSSIYSECVSSVLRRDRMDKRTEEATYVSTDSIKMTGSVRFEVYDRDDLLLSGVLELLSNDNGAVVREQKNNCRKWRIKCHSVLVSGGNSFFLKGKKYLGPDTAMPAVEVYVAGSFSGSPIILTKTLQLGSSKKHKLKGILDSIPEYDPAEPKKQVPCEDALQLSENNGFEPENDVDFGNNNVYSSGKYIEEEDDGEISWFNAGVKVGVGLGLGICLGIGIGVGLLVRTYQATTKNFKKPRILS